MDSIGQSDIITLPDSGDQIAIYFVVTIINIFVVVPLIQTDIHWKIVITHYSWSCCSLEMTPNFRMCSIVGDKLNICFMFRGRGNFYFFPQMSFGGWVIVITGLVLFGETSSLSHPGHNLMFCFKCYYLMGWIQGWRNCFCFWLYLHNMSPDVASILGISHPWLKTIRWWLSLSTIQFLRSICITYKYKPLNTKRSW